MQYSYVQATSLKVGDVIAVPINYGKVIIGTVSEVSVYEKSVMVSYNRTTGGNTSATHQTFCRSSQVTVIDFGKRYSLAEIRNGTGWPARVRFIAVQGEA